MPASVLEIYCPRCHWRPTATERWQCSCGCQWNTFATAGVCPRCQRRWRHTACTTAAAGGCGLMSPHIDWYHGLDAAIAELMR